MAGKMAKMSKEERFAKLAEKLRATDVGKGNSGFWTPKQGRQIIRVLPEVGEMKFFYQEVGKHSMPPDRKKSVYCPKFTTAEELDCPVCELVDDLYRSGDKISKALAKGLRVKKMYWMSVIVRGKVDPNTHEQVEEDSGPFIYTPGVKVFGEIMNYILDPEYGDVTDVEDGFDIILTRTGTGIETEYSVKPRRNSSPLSKSDQQAQDWLNAAKDLAWVELSEDPEEDSELSKDHAIYVLPYERIMKEFGLEDFDIDNIDLDKMKIAVDGDEAVEEEAPKRKAARREVDDDVPFSRSKPKAKKEEPEEEEEEEEEAEKEVSRRMARRRSR